MCEFEFKMVATWDAGVNHRIQPSVVHPVASIYILSSLQRLL